MKFSKVILPVAVVAALTTPEASASMIEPLGAKRTGATLTDLCIRLGVQPNTRDMKRCVTAAGDGERRTVADRAVYGTK